MSSPAPDAHPQGEAVDPAASDVHASEAAGRADAPAPESDSSDHEAHEAHEGLIARLEDQVRRGAADLDNLRKRHVRERDRERLTDRMRAAELLLPVVDNLELALQHAGEKDDPFVEGVRAVHQQAVAALARLGFPRFDAEGQRFDPTLHEAVSSYPDADRAGTVLAVTRPGYGTPEALLRPAQVVVAVAPSQ